MISAKDMDWKFSVNEYGRKGLFFKDGGLTYELEWDDGCELCGLTVRDYSGYAFLAFGGKMKLLVVALRHYRQVKRGHSLLNAALKFPPNPKQWHHHICRVTGLRLVSD
jgi:hypothetical protein